jgi:hypothetical protein
MRESLARAIPIRMILGLTVFVAAAGAVTASEAQVALKSNAGFPIVVNKSGTYKLTANLNVPADVDGIVVEPGVIAVIDLSGFTIKGPAQCFKGSDCFVFNGTVGIRVAPGSTLQVSNGHVRGFTRLAIGDPGAFNFSKVIANKVQVTNSGSGLAAYLVMAEHVLAMDNAGIGISAEKGSVLHSLAVSNNQGIFVAMGTVRGCVARANTLQGFLFQRTTHQDNVTFDNGTPTAGEGAFSPGTNNAYND